MTSATFVRSLFGKTAGTFSLSLEDFTPCTNTVVGSCLAGNYCLEIVRNYSSVNSYCFEIVRNYLSTDNYRPGQTKYN